MVNSLQVFRNLVTFILSVLTLSVEEIFPFCDIPRTGYDIRSVWFSRLLSGFQSALLPFRTEPSGFQRSPTLQAFLPSGFQRFLPIRTVPSGFQNCSYPSGFLNRQVFRDSYPSGVSHPVFRRAPTHQVYSAIMVGVAQ